MGSNFRDNLRSELDFQGIIVKELSVRTKIPVSTLDSYLRTRSTEPSAENAIKIAQALQISVESLMVGEDARCGRRQTVLNREIREIIHRVEKLTPEQRKAILKLLTVIT